ncbi:hypothetical protein CEXT_590681 [Caerostris extrusa]|uniref:Uncharacterized protein n=1 Tax=Caerostris extrusa TaxID=172846 RepID=A0AAV4XCT2_CAEEX|nr:hypothetical protein CEXT_590681 [Caerostris extrusa]
MKSSHASSFSLHPHLHPYSDMCQYPISLFIFHVRQNAIRNCESLFFSFQCSTLLFFRPSVGSCNKWEKICLSYVTYLPFSTIPPPIFPLRKITGTRVIPCSIKSGTQLVWSFMNVLCYFQ